MFPSERQITAAVGAGDQIYYLTLPAGKKSTERCTAAKLIVSWNVIIAEFGAVFQNPANRPPMVSAVLELYRDSVLHHLIWPP